MATKADADYFANTFNRLVGRHTGRTIQSRPGKTVRKEGGRYIGKQALAAVRHGTQRAPREVKREIEATFGRADNGRDPATQLEEALTRVAGQQDSIAERNARIQETFEALVEKDDNFQNSIAGRALDIISRPAYGVFEGLRSARQASNEGQTGFWETWDEALSGVGRGLTGEAKTGFGDYIEEFKGSDTGIGGMLNELEEEHPEASKWVQRGLGLGGELVLDPLNAISGGTVAVAREGGTKLTTEALQEAAEKMARESADKVFANIPLPSMNRPGIAGGRVSGRQAVTDIAGKAASESVGKQALEIMGGPNRGKLLLGRNTTAPTVANAVFHNVRDSILGNFEKKYGQFTNAMTGKGPALTQRQVRNFISYDPKFREFWNNILTEFNATRPKNPINNLADAIKALRSQSATHVEDVLSRAAQKVRDDLDAPAGLISDDVLKGLTDFYYNAPALRVGGVSIPIRPIGRAYSKVSKTIRESGKFPTDLAESLSYGSQFPGRLAQIGQSVRSRGMRAFDTEKGEIRQIFKGINNEEARVIQDALEQQIQLADPRLERARVELQQRYEKLFRDEIAFSARGRDGAGLAHADDYAFVYNKGGSLSKRTEWKNARKQAIKNNQSTAGYRTADAKKAGLRPVEHAGEAYLYRLMKHNRDMSKAWFLRDLIDHYGFQAGKVSDKAMASRNLVEVKPSWVPQDLKQALPSPDTKVYLPKEMMEIYKKWENLTKISNASLDSIRRNLQNITNKYKTIVTLPLPGFHIRNMVFDYFMGLMDGIPTRTYMEVLNKAARKNTTSFTLAPGISKSWHEMWDLFRSHASSGGFYHTDIGANTGLGRFKNLSPFAAINKRFESFPESMREMAELREDFGRFVHFVGAMRDEAGKIVARGGKKNVDEVVDKAMEQAVYRVNHYKFDYGALTAFERKNLKLLFPFYTFARKSVPMMIEALFLSPKLLSRTYRFMSDPREDGDTHLFNSVMTPAWMREIGYAQLTEEKEPWVIGGDVMPTAPFNTIDWPFNTSPTDPNTEDFLQSVLSQGNPFINLLYEQTQNQRIFSGQDPGSLTEQLLNMAGPYGPIKDVTGDSNRSFIEQLLSSRVFTGMSTRRLSEEEQAYAENELEDRTIDDPFREFNYSQERYRIYKSDNGARIIFRLKDLATNRVIFESDDPREVLREANERL